MKLYSVRQCQLIEAEVVRETRLFYFVDTSALTDWSKRIAKTDVNSAHGCVADTAKGAWTIEQNKARAEEQALAQKVRRNAERRQAAQLALDAIWTEERQ